MEELCRAEAAEFRDVVIPLLDDAGSAIYENRADDAMRAFDALGRALDAKIPWATLADFDAFMDDEAQPLEL